MRNGLIDLASVKATTEQLSQTLQRHAKTTSLRVAATTHALGKGDAIKAALRAQTTLHLTLCVNHPQQGEGAALLAEQVADLAVKDARCVGHQTSETVKDQGLR